MEHNKRLELALRAGAKSIQNNKRLHGMIYVLDPFGTPSEIPYLEAAQILRDEANRLQDEALEDLWRQFGDVPMNPETECMDEAFHIWPQGTPREDIWHWFDARHSKGVAYLLYGPTEKEVKE